ncbi:MAG: glycosyltransferase family 4 protein [Planctomycetaceae bacterium]|jgi:glycosyltransferase involved in cell wall biosynthesis|nr:glycosyltransferase family 4 protein [Planctomycetaceae bacterium]
MKMIYLSPGAGKQYCGNCLRDNALAAELRRQGHDVVTVPLYLPPTLDGKEPLTSPADDNVPVFFGGVNVYLAQKLPGYKYVPSFVRRLLDSRLLLKQIDPPKTAGNSLTGELTVSMLKGEHGYQKQELDELCNFLKAEQPDVAVFSNALLLGMNNAVKKETGAKTVCMLSGEDSFLDNLYEPFQSEAWKLVAEHLADVDIVTAPSRFYANFMTERLRSAAEIVPPDIKILPPGINTDGYNQNATVRFSGGTSAAAHIGFFARMTYSKGLDTLIDAFVEVRRRRNFYPKLKIGGGYSKHDAPFLQQQNDKLGYEALETQADVFPNLSREEKIRFLESLTLFSVPSRLNEPFGLFVLEAFAAGVPCLFPNRGAFPEIAEQSGACVLFEPENPVDLADKIEKLLADEEKRKEMSANAQRIIREKWSIENALAFTRLCV